MHTNRSSRPEGRVVPLTMTQAQTANVSSAAQRLLATADDELFLECLQEIVGMRDRVGLVKNVALDDREVFTAYYRSYCQDGGAIREDDFRAMVLLRPAAELGSEIVELARSDSAFLQAIRAVLVRRSP